MPIGKRGLVAATGTALAALLLAVFVVVPSLMPLSWVLGAEIQSADTYEVPKGTTLDDDLYAFSNTVTVAGTLSHDLVGVVGDVVISGEVGGSVDVLASSVDISGTVGRNVRSAVQDLVISGTVKGDVIVAAGTLTITETGVVEGDVISASGELVIDGTVEGEIRGTEVGEGQVVTGVVVNNTDAGAAVATVVNGDGVQGAIGSAEAGVAAAQDAAGTVEAGVSTVKTAVANPPATSTGGSGDGSGATTGGDGGDGGLGIGDAGIVGSNLPSWDDLARLWNFYRLAAALFAGLLIALILPRSAQRVATTAKTSPFMTLIVGVASVVLLALLAAVLFVTIIGIPFAFALVAFFTALAYTSQVFVGIALARVLFDKLKLGQGRGGTLLSAWVGIVAIWGLRLVPYEAFGSVVGFVVVIICWGAVLLTLFRIPKAVTAK